MEKKSRKDISTQMQEAIWSASESYDLRIQGSSADFLRRSLINTAKAHDITLNAWAKKASISEGTIRNFLKGKSDTLTVATLDKLCQSIGENVAALLGGMPLRNKNEVAPLKYEIDEEWSIRDEIDLSWKQEEIYFPSSSRYSRNVPKFSSIVTGTTTRPSYPRNSYLVCMEISPKWTDQPYSINIMGGEWHGNLVICDYSDFQTEEGRGIYMRSRAIVREAFVFNNDIIFPHEDMSMWAQRFGPTDDQYDSVSRDEIEIFNDQYCWHEHSDQVSVIAGVVIANFRMESVQVISD